MSTEERKKQTVEQAREKHTQVPANEPREKQIAEGLSVPTKTAQTIKEPPVIVSAPKKKAAKRAAKKAKK